MVVTMFSTRLKKVTSQLNISQVYFRSMVALLGLAILLVGSWSSFLLLSQSQDLRREAAKIEPFPTLPPPPPWSGDCTPPPSCAWQEPFCPILPETDYCLPPDFDHDRDVDKDDYFFLQSRFFGTTQDALKADVNVDGLVDLYDYSLLVKYWTGEIKPPADI